MARYTDAKCRLCRREGEKLFLKGTRCMTAKCAIERQNYPPGQHGQTGGGQSVKHTYDSTGRYNVFVSVTGSDDSAGSSDEVRITIGNPPATGTTGGGGSTGGANPTPTSPPPVVNNTPQTPPAPIDTIPKTEGTPGATKVTGILLASSSPVSADSLLSPGSRPLASTSSTPDLEVPLVGAAVVLLLGLGAFFEGGGRIRIPKLWPR